MSLNVDVAASIALNCATCRRDLGVADQRLTFQDACDQQADDNHDDGQFDERKARLCLACFSVQVS